MSKTRCKACTYFN